MPPLPLYLRLVQKNYGFSLQRHCIHFHYITLILSSVNMGYYCGWLNWRALHWTLICEVKFLQMMPQTTYCFQSTCTAALTAMIGSHQLAGRFMTAQMSAQQSYIVTFSPLWVAISLWSSSADFYGPDHLNAKYRSKSTKLTQSNMAPTQLTVTVPWAFRHGIHTRVTRCYLSIKVSTPIRPI